VSVRKERERERERKRDGRREERCEAGITTPVPDERNVVNAISRDVRADVRPTRTNLHFVLAPLGAIYGDDRDCAADNDQGSYPVSGRAAGRRGGGRRGGLSLASRKSASRLRVPVGRGTIKLLRLTPYRRAECLEPLGGAMRHEAQVYRSRGGAATPAAVPSPSSSLPALVLPLDVRLVTHTDARARARVCGALPFTPLKPRVMQSANNMVARGRDAPLRHMHVNPFGVLTASLPLASRKLLVSRARAARDRQARTRPSACSYRFCERRFTEVVDSST